MPDERDPQGGEQTLGGPDEFESLTGLPEEPSVESLESREAPPAPGDSRDRAEPEVRAAEAPVAPAAPSGPSVDERLGRALATIEGLQREVGDLRSRTAEPSVRSQVEMVEVLGARIARDPASRPIQITANDLLALGWNEDPANAINVLANVFYDLIHRTVPRGVFETLAQRGAETASAQTRLTDFWTAYPDLRDHADLCQMYDVRAWNSGWANGRSQGEYNSIVAHQARSTIARMRGQSIEQYNASLASRAGANGGAQGAPRSRQVTGAAPGGRQGRSTPLSDQEREMFDLMQ